MILIVIIYIFIIQKFWILSLHLIQFTFQQIFYFLINSILLIYCLSSYSFCLNGKKKTAQAVATVKQGTGKVTVRGVPIDTIRPEILRSKVAEPLQLAGQEAYNTIDIAVEVRGGGYVAQVYAIRQSIAKAIIGNIKDETQKNNLKSKFVEYDRHLLVADPRQKLEKRWGGRGARTRRQKSYR